MRKIILLLLLVLLTSISFAQKDVDAEKILTKVSETYKSYNSFRIKFNLTIENVEEQINETSVGVADIKGVKYKVDIMGAETYFDGKTRYTFLKDSEEVNISEPEDEESELANPAKIFDLYKNGFDYSIVKMFKKAGNEVVEIVLIPNEERDYTKVFLIIDIKTYNVVYFSSVGKDGNNLVLKMSNLETNQNFEDSHFVFDIKANPNVEVVDMR